MKSRGEITGDKRHSGVTLSKRKSDSDLICEEKRSLIFLPSASTKEAAGCEVEEGALAHVPHFGDENSDDELLRMSRSDSRRNSLETRAEM